jgi:tetratricopeptide (TPR) repeat protein
MAKMSRAKTATTKKTSPKMKKKSSGASKPVKKTPKSGKTSAKKPKPLKKKLKVVLAKPVPAKKRAAQKAVKAKPLKVSSVAMRSALKPKAASRKPVSQNSNKGILIKQYEVAMKLVYSQEYEKAREALEKIIQTATLDKDIVERSRSLLRLCQQKLSSGASVPRTLEEHYNLAVAQMNQGLYKESQEHLHKALKSNPQSDFVLYALAGNQCRLGHFAEALDHLKAAIELKPENRYLARNDGDFEALQHDPRFLALVFPERENASA